MDLSVHIEDTPIPALSASPRVVMQFEIIDATGSSRGESRSPLSGRLMRVLDATVSSRPKTSDRRLL